MKYIRIDFDETKVISRGTGHIIIDVEQLNPTLHQTNVSITLLNPNPNFYFKYIKKLFVGPSGGMELVK